MKHADIYKEMVATLARAGTCPKARVGALILRDGRIISTGYNGSLSGTPHCIDEGCIMRDGHCIRAVHAEMNALMHTAKYGIATNGCELVVTHSPCYHCTKLLVMAGIRDVYCIEMRKPENNPFLSSLEVKLL